MYDKLNKPGTEITSLLLPDSFWKSIWKIDMSQRVKVFLWKCIQNVIATNVNLYGKVDNINPNCTMCGENLETAEHLFFHCSYAREIWEMAPNPISLQLDPATPLLDTYKDWIKNPRQEISLELILTKIWMIWKERCNRVFESKIRTTTQLSQDILLHLSFWTRNHSKPTKQNKKITAHKPSWIAPVHNTKKINIYAAWDSSITPSSFALILRNDRGYFERSRAGPSRSIDPQEAEAIRVYQTTVWAKEKHLKDYSIEGDCESCFNYLQGKHSEISWRSKALLNEASKIIKESHSVLSFHFISRLGNTVADALVNFVKSLSLVTDWDMNPLTCILKKLAVHKSNIRKITQLSILDGSTWDVMEPPLKC
ncbi:uncharacterized protein LOC113329069 [Papaver somniferum]|uniref:uncharacterized protein LOC113329069 n=1 Tax=Papaver somniferum TaxID=3469 RepID=UPI000E700E16|nr:uncharacterized protein LOC113329069 [Papaver somniferum]